MAVQKTLVAINQFHSVNGKVVSAMSADFCAGICGWLLKVQLTSTVDGFSSWREAA